jgi:hypothetical protein
MDVVLPDGTIIKDVPEGTTKADLVARLERNGRPVPAEWLAQAKSPEPIAVQAGQSVNSIPRQLGLTARYALEGPAQLAQLITEPIRLATQNLEGANKSRPLSDVVSQFADRLGLPQPQGANERVVGDASRMVAAAGAGGLAGRAAQAVPGAVGEVGKFFASNPAQQAVSAAGAGLGGGASREAGGGPWSQFGASLLGGLAGPLGLSAVQKAGTGAINLGRQARDALAPGVFQPQQVDQQISLALSSRGIDWATVPEAIKQTMRAEVAQALDTGGELNPDAVRRLLDFKRVGTTPTRGMLTQDPVQITKEMNLAKVGANSTDLGLQRLPRLQNENTQKLLDVLDIAGAKNAPDAFATGERVIGSLDRSAKASKANIDSLYAAARDTTGRSAALDGAAFTTRANQMLDEKLLGYAVPKSVADKLNQIAMGEVPFTVDFAEQLKTTMGVIQRADKGGATSAAMGVIRKALDETPLRPAAQVNPGNLPAVPGTVPPSPAALGEDAIQAFNRARQANRGFMQRVEQTPALQAAIDGVAPDRFVLKYITGQGASARDVQAMRRAMGSDPQALEAVKQTLVAHLKDAATTNTADVAKFSPAGYNRALNNIGDRKLAVFFSPSEIELLRSVGRNATLIFAQPTGTAVNNSNTAAMAAGRLLTVLDTVSGKMPLGLDNLIQGTIRGVQQGNALKIPTSLLDAPPKIPLWNRMGPASIYGGLLATQPVEQP